MNVGEVLRDERLASHRAELERTIVAVLMEEFSDELVDGMAIGEWQARLIARKVLSQLAPYIE